MFLSTSLKLTQVTKCIIDRMRQISEEAGVHCISIDTQLSGGESPPVTMDMEKRGHIRQRFGRENWQDVASNWMFNGIKNRDYRS